MSFAEIPAQHLGFLTGLSTLRLVMPLVLMDHGDAPKGKSSDLWSEEKDPPSDKSLQKSGSDLTKESAVPKGSTLRPSEGDENEAESLLGTAEESEGDGKAGSLIAGARRGTRAENGADSLLGNAEESEGDEKAPGSLIAGPVGGEASEPEEKEQTESRQSLRDAMKYPQ